jgi:murein DD-endopeptidase MepM/ murein hydrolase activator NlpD
MPLRRRSPNRCKSSSFPRSRCWNVVIDHGNGEFSHLGHLRPGSVQVALGDKVRAGQPIAQIGTSGSSLFPHLHYQLASGPTLDAEGLPSPFVKFDRVLGSTRARADGTSPDSGDIVEAR